MLVLDSRNFWLPLETEFIQALVSTSYADIATTIPISFAELILFVNLKGDGIGDSCSSDYDGDRIPDTEDTCPNNNHITRADFREHQTVSLDPYGDSQVDPEWKVSNEVRDNRYFIEWRDQWKTLFEVA